MNPLSNLGVASIPAVKQYWQQAQQEGIACESLLQRADIASATLSDNGAHVTGEQFQRLLIALLQQSTDSLFGLHSAQFVQASSYSVLGFMSMNCLTLGEAIECIVPFERLVGDMGVSSVVDDRDGGTVLLRWECRYKAPSIIPHMVDNVLASWLQFARLLVGESLNPNMVNLRRSAPKSLQDLQEYQRVFGSHIHFNASDDGLVFPIAFKHLPIQSGNAVLRQALETHAKQLLSELEVSHAQPFSALVSQYIQQGLAINQYRQQDIAVSLNVSVKTLQRRLKSEQTTFQLLLDTIRHEKACSLLSTKHLTIEEISELLGFRDVRSFYHHFRKVEGLTPTQYRNTLRP